MPSREFWKRRPSGLARISAGPIGFRTGFEMMIAFVCFENI
jgi:hypothetical protein